MDLTRELKMQWNMKVTVIRPLGTISKGLVKGPGKHRNQKITRDYPDYSINMIDQNLEKCPGDLKRLAVTQTPEKNYQLTLV